MNPKVFYEAHIYDFLAFIPPMGAIVDDHNPLTGNSVGIRHFDFIIKGVESNPEKKLRICSRKTPTSECWGVLLKHC